MASRQRSKPDGSWYARKGPPHEAIVSTVDRLIGEKRRDELALWRDLFLDRQPTSSRAANAAGYVRHGMRARMNIVRNACESLLARVGKNQPRPWIVTVGGNWKLQRKAKRMGRFVEGDWERLGSDRLRRNAVRDALIYGKGILKVWPDHERGRVQWARVWCGDVFTHQREERVGHVRTKYQIAFVDRAVAASTWPEHKLEISELGPIDSKLMRDNTADHGDDLILVYEAWRLPSGCDKKGEPTGGRHVVCIAGATLEDEPWTRDHFPFAEITATDDPESSEGVGYSERMAGAQSEQNALAELASDVARLMTPKYVLQNGSQFSVDAASNGIEFWQFTGDVPTVLSAENNILAIMQAAAIQRQAAYAIEGISDSSAEGSMPAHLDSGKAGLVNRDIESERHVELAKRVEEFTPELCKLHIECLEELAEDKHDLVAYSGKSMLEELRYEDVRLGDDPYHVRVYPVSALSNSPQGKLAQLNEMLAAGVITTAEWRELYDMPDLDRSNDLAFAGRELARKLVEQALDGEVVAATRACDLPFLVDQAWKEHARAQLEGADEMELEHVRDLAGAAQSLIDQQLAEEQAKAAASMPPPMPPPMPMPPAAAPPPIPPMGIQGVVP